MKKLSLLSAVILLLLCTGCKKQSLQNLSTPPPSFIQFVIPGGEHYVANNVYKPLDVASLKFTVRFDSTAIYTTSDPQNQYDINKLYGFADNNEFHQQFSARIGWRWSNGALRLFAYVYNNGIRDEKEITPVAIGEEHQCSIQVADSLYLFSVDGKGIAMPRKSITPTAKGYQLYPYFGGDEAAPHDVRIWIREE